MLKIEKSIFLTRPVIGIVGRLEKGFISITSKVKDACIKCGALPIIILMPNCDNLSNSDKEFIISEISLCDGIIAPGGSVEYLYDLFISEYCKENDIPYLGICLGMQVMTSFNNYLVCKNNHDFKNLKYSHYVNINKNSILYKFFGDRILVNSRHKYKIKDVKDYIIGAVSDDGVIEAIEYSENKFNVGLQWHIEDMVMYDDKQKLFFDYFIYICKKYAK